MKKRIPNIIIISISLIIIFVSFNKFLNDKFEKGIFIEDKFEINMFIERLLGVSEKLNGQIIELLPEQYKNKFKVRNEPSAKLNEVREKLDFLEYSYLNIDNEKMLVCIDSIFAKDLKELKKHYSKIDVPTALNNMNLYDINVNQNVMNEIKDLQVGEIGSVKCDLNKVDNIRITYKEKEQDNNCIILQILRKDGNLSTEDIFPLEHYEIEKISYNNSEYINNCFKLNKNIEKGIAKIVNKDNYKYIIDIQIPTKPNGDFKNLTEEEVLQIIDNLDVEKIIYDIYN